MTQESSATISHEAIQMGEELYESTIEMLVNKMFVNAEELIIQDNDEECQFQEEQEDEEYLHLEKEQKSTKYIPVEYKIKVVNMAKEHPKWSLKNLQRKGCSRLKSIIYIDGKKILNVEERQLINTPLIPGHTTVSWKPELINSSK